MDKKCDGKSGFDRQACKRFQKLNVDNRHLIIYQIFENANKIALIQNSEIHKSQVKTIPA